MNRGPGAESASHQSGRTDLGDVDSLTPMGVRARTSYRFGATIDATTPGEERVRTGRQGSDEAHFVPLGQPAKRLTAHSTICSKMNGSTAPWRVEVRSLCRRLARQPRRGAPVRSLATLRLSMCFRQFVGTPTYRSFSEDK